jgi:peptidoglycan-associated lipoprotein
MKNYLIVSLFAFLTIAGCSSTKHDVKANNSPQLVTPLPAPSATTQSASETNMTATKTTKLDDPLNDPTNVLAKRSVYFEYDQSIIKDEYVTLIEAHGKYLSKHPERRLVIQGNTDERGGSEYNLALGQRRADAVKKMLQIYGASDSQLEAISFGKEKPKASGSGESVWAENRRADLAY